MWLKSNDNKSHGLLQKSFKKNEVMEMGYIPPVKNSQLDQYAERDIKNNYDYSHVGPLIKTNATSSQTLVSQGNTMKKALKKKRSTLKKAVKSKATELTISEITGKGRNFNRSV